MADLIEPGSISCGQQVTNAGTDVAITAGVCRTVVIKALNTNTGLVYVGDAGVAAADGFVLRANESVTLSISNRSTVYFDVAVNGEGVSWISVA